MCSHYETPEQREVEDWYRLSNRDPHPLAEYPLHAWPKYAAPFAKQDNETGERALVVGHFGIVPSWTKPDKLKISGRGTYNARTETVHELPSFTTSWKHRKWCIIPAAAIYEPCYEPEYGKSIGVTVPLGKSAPVRIARADGKLHSIAGIWYSWKNGATGEYLQTFSMLTINAADHPMMRHMHKPSDEKRMVVMLQDDQHEAWLNATHDEARTFFCQYPAELLAAGKATP